MNGRICLECKHCYLWAGSPGYSEYTPAEPFDFSCHKNHKFVFKQGSYANKANMIADLKKAETCPDFELETPAG